MILCAKFRWNNLCMWFWKRKFLKCSFTTLLLYQYGRGMALYLNTFEPFHHFVTIQNFMFGWNWTRGSWEDFTVYSMYIQFVIIISSMKRVWPLIWINVILISFTKECFMPSLVDIGWEVVEKTMKMWKFKTMTATTDSK